MHVAIVGGGVAGLVAARTLSLRRQRVTLFEASARLGGQLVTDRVDRWVVEHGAEGFVAESAAVLELCGELGLADEIVGQRERRAFALRGGTLAELPAGEAALLLGLQARAADLGKGLLTLRNGMSDLVQALAAPPAQDAVPVRLVAGARVVALGVAGDRLMLVTAAGVMIAADAVVLACSPAAAAAIVAGPAPEAAAMLDGLRRASSAMVTLAYHVDAVAHRLDGSGFVATAGESADGLLACTFSSSKFAGRAPDDGRLVRAFFRPDQRALADADAVWAERAERALMPILGIRGTPLRCWISRWPEARPIYGEDHDERIAAVRHALRRVGRVELAGAAYDRSGIDGAVRSGRAAGRRIAGSAPAGRPLVPLGSAHA